jgi:hypothetical protein
MSAEPPSLPPLLLLAACGVMLSLLPLTAGSSNLTGGTPAAPMPTCPRTRCVAKLNVRFAPPLIRVTTARIRLRGESDGDLAGCEGMCEGGLLATMACGEGMSRERAECSARLVGSRDT